MCHPARADRRRIRSPNTLPQHLAPLRAPASETSSDFGLLCVPQPVAVSGSKCQSKQQQTYGAARLAAAPLAADRVSAASIAASALALATAASVSAARLAAANVSACCARLRPLSPVAVAALTACQPVLRSSAHSRVCAGRVGIAHAVCAGSWPACVALWLAAVSLCHVWLGRSERARAGRLGPVRSGAWA